mmetsp:Transcript_6159/g.18609  ORF Transcript_6159/g.18609 Transcript_6159/m.18609 type:complete len:474 (-) Transcript_6159:142-1563(-)
MSSAKFSILEEAEEEDGDIEMATTKASAVDEASALDEDGEDGAEKGAAPAYSRAPLVALCCGMFANSFALMNPVPYCGFMVIRFGVAEDKRSAGYYAGLVMTSFMAGRFLSSFYCGVLSDTRSRKFVIRISLWSCVVFQLLFGLSTTYSTALAARGAMGFFNGLAGVTKAALPELVPPAEQQTAMGYVTTMFTFGMIAGPAVGGLLAGKGLASRPYLLPNAIGAVLALASVVAVEIFLPATRAKSRSDDDDRPCCALPAASRAPVALYSVYSFIMMAYDEIYPLWLLSPVDSGGLEMHSGKIGTVMAATACGNVVAMLLVFPALSARLPSPRLFRLACAALAFLALLPPGIAALRASPAVTWPLLIAHSVLLRFATSCCYTAIFVCINDSAPAETRGTVNGLAMSVASAFKAVGPMTAAVFAWSLHSHLPPPFDEHFVFVSVSLMLAVSAVVAAFTLPTSAKLPVLGEDASGS